MIGQIENQIKNEKVNAEAALKSVTDMFISMFEGMTRQCLHARTCRRYSRRN